MAGVNYFEKLPLINYKDNYAKNILVKAKLSNFADTTGAVFYPYTIEEGERADTIAQNYYGDARFDWLVYLSNDITDPYYDWPLDNDKLFNFIKQKYGSVDKSKRQVLYFKNNWEEDDSLITVSQYEGFSSSLRKYWAPVIGYSRTITSYKRKQFDKYLETNKTIKLTVADSAIFSIGNIADQKIDGELVGSGEVKFKDSTSITVQKIIGSFTSGSGSLINFDTTSSTTISDVELINQPISNTEGSYWTTVFAFDYEFELNENKRYIKLIDSGLVEQIEDEFKSIF
jgi:hypothetical protein